MNLTVRCWLWVEYCEKRNSEGLERANSCRSQWGIHFYMTCNKELLEGFKLENDMKWQKRFLWLLCQRWTVERGNNRIRMTDQEFPTVIQVRWWCHTLGGKESGIYLIMGFQTHENRTVQWTFIYVLTICRHHQPTGMFVYILTFYCLGYFKSKFGMSYHIISRHISVCLEQIKT